jgi:hypothetical protein
MPDSRNQCCPENGRRFRPSLALGYVSRGRNGHRAPIDNASSYGIAVFINTHIHDPYRECRLSAGRASTKLTDRDPPILDIPSKLFLSKAGNYNIRRCFLRRRATSPGFHRLAEVIAGHHERSCALRQFIEDVHRNLTLR